LAEDEVCQFTGDFYDFTYGFIPIKKKTKTKNHHTFLNFPKARNMEERKGLSNPRKAAYNGKSSSHSGVGQC